MLVEQELNPKDQRKARGGVPGLTPSTVSPPECRVLGVAVWKVASAGCLLPTLTPNPDQSGAEQQLVHSAPAEEMQARSVKTCNKLLNSTDCLRRLCWGSVKRVIKLFISLLVFYPQEKGAGADAAMPPSLQQHRRQAALLFKHSK